MEYHCKINDRTLFDCENLISHNEKETVLSDSDLIPNANEEDELFLGKVKFNVRSSIFPSASTYEIIQGWDHLFQYLQLDEALRLDRITEIFVVEYLIKLRRIPPSMFCYAEPDITDCARLAYWYYLCLKNDNDKSFQHKMKEIKGKLRRRLLTNLEQFKSSYSYKDNEETFEHVERIPDGERIRKVVKSLPKIKLALPVNKQTKNQYNDYMYQWFKEVFSINAELRFAALCSLNGYKVSFAPHNELHDYDFLINFNNIIPVQVKANIIYRGDSDRTKKYLADIQEIIRMSHYKTLTIEYVKDKVLKFISTEYLAQIRKAIEQKARIVFIDGTQSSVGFALNKWASDNITDDFSIKKSLSDALSSYTTENNFIPLVFAAGAYDYNYRLSSICLGFPLIKSETGLTADDNRLDSINFINE